MKVAYFDCFSGISGDMFIGALIDAGLDLDDLRSELGKLDVPDMHVNARKVSKKNIAATRFEVVDKGEKRYRHLPDLNRIVDEGNLSDKVKAQAKEIFLAIAKAEAKIHNQPLEKVHFHEVGALDTIVDVVGALVGLEKLRIQRVFSSPLNVGSGTVEFSHGVFPVPAPATAELLAQTPVYSNEVQGELVTPTGAALIAALASSFGPMPLMTLSATGYGAGTRDLERPNVLRVLIGEMTGQEEETIVVIESNIDDMNPEFYDHVLDQLFGAGALDVYCSNILMKKTRPATKLTVLGKPEDEQKLSQIILSETTSLGVRVRREWRHKLAREIVQVQTAYGKIQCKVSRLAGKIVTKMPEYEACRQIATQLQVPLKQIYAAAELALAEQFRD
jgi:uncharacterized protein (TIGR00299 family) protein